MERPVALRLDVDDLFLPLPVALDVVEVREDILGLSVDLDALADWRHLCLLFEL